jgi:uncharacterized protein (DUF2236 family)
MTPALPRRQTFAPHADYGFFGPDSVTWKVWTYPTSLTIGFQRSVVIEELDPALIAAVDATGDVYSRPRTRYDRTLRYFAMISLGGSEAAARASNVLVKVHAKGVGVEPLSGNRYDANDPHSQLWIHLTAWHSILYAYEKYGPGRLTEEEENRYWEECAVAAELQTCDPADVPRTREGIREYFESMRPRLAGSEAAQKMMDHLLNAKVMFPPVPRVLVPANLVINQLLRRATIATMPQWMRKLAGLRQSRLTDALIVPLMKLAFRGAHSSPRLAVLGLGFISPSTVPIAAPVILGIEPVRQETTTPSAARARLGLLSPPEEYARFRALIEERTATGHGDDAELQVGPTIPESVAMLGAV